MARTKKIRNATDLTNEEINKLLDLTPALPDDIDQWVNKKLFYNKNYFFTKTNKGVKVGKCTACGVTSQIYPTPNQQPDEIIRAQTKHNDKSICPHCYKSVQFKDNGRGKKTLIDCGYIYLLQPLANGMLVYRTIYVWRYWDNVNVFGYPNKPTLSYSEHFRFYFGADTIACFKRNYNYYYRYYSDNVWQGIKKTIVPWPHYGNTYNSTDFNCGLYNRNLNDVICNNPYKYSCLEKFLVSAEIDSKYGCKDCFHGSLTALPQYLELYIKYPILVERFMKRNLVQLVVDKLRPHSKSISNTIINWRADTPEQATKLNKQLLNKLTERSDKDISTYTIATEQLKKRNPFSDVTEEFLASLEKSEIANFCKIANLLKNQSVNKICKYLRKQKKIYTSNYIYANNYLFNDYLDYIRQAKSLDMDIESKNVIYPPNLDEAHRQASAIFSAKKLKSEIAKLKKEDSEFAPIFKKLSEQYEYSNEQFIIRPATGKKDLYIEGTTLGHCVYSNYSDRYINGSTVILLIRNINNIDTPFYTLEFNPKRQAIVQCRGRNNCSPTQEVSNFTKEWLQFIQLSKKKKDTLRKQSIKNIEIAKSA